MCTPLHLWYTTVCTPPLPGWYSLGVTLSSTRVVYPRCNTLLNRVYHRVYILLQPGIPQGVHLFHPGYTLGVTPSSHSGYTLGVTPSSHPGYTLGVTPLIHPFHCWAHPYASPNTRFTVGHTLRALLHHPFHCWTLREELVLTPREELVLTPRKEPLSHPEEGLFHTPKQGELGSEPGRIRLRNREN